MKIRAWFRNFFYFLFPTILLTIPVFTIWYRDNQHITYVDKQLMAFWIVGCLLVAAVAATIIFVRLAKPDTETITCSGQKGMKKLLDRLDILFEQLTNVQRTHTTDTLRGVYFQGYYYFMRGLKESILVNIHEKTVTIQAPKRLIEDIRTFIEDIRIEL